ncbi:MAG: 16S rRNA (guanine(966)-N(2))-methyltransferase RsmD [Bacilli bacterium]|nr:16S rRNA (guanine(966)-N(2))-methyltransferase RsmD [Bacilli bacterium]
MIKLVSGKYRSRSIEVPPSVTVPTKSIVRTAILNALTNDVTDARVLDLFAGSGALGFEALSRGARFCQFVDNSAEVVAVLKQNILTLKDNSSNVFYGGYDRYFEVNPGVKFDIVFLDPPYADKDVYANVPAFLIKEEILSENGVVVLEYEGEINPPLELYASNRHYKYGRTHVMILRK